jgi:hypothetical protein
MAGGGAAVAAAAMTEVDFIFLELTTEVDRGGG